MQNCNEKRGVASVGGTVHLSTHVQDALDARCIAAGDRVVQETLFAGKLGEYVLSLHRLSESAKVLLQEEGEDGVLSAPGVCRVETEDVN